MSCNKCLRRRPNGPERRGVVCQAAIYGGDHPKTMASSWLHWPIPVSAEAHEAGNEKASTWLTSAFTLRSFGFWNSESTMAPCCLTSFAGWFNGLASYCGSGDAAFQGHRLRLRFREYRAVNKGHSRSAIFSQRSFTSSDVGSSFLDQSRCYIDLKPSIMLSLFLASSWSLGGTLGSYLVGAYRFLTLSTDQVLVITCDIQRVPMGP